MVPKQNNMAFASLSISTAFSNREKLYSNDKYLEATVPMRDKERPWEDELRGRRPDRRCHLDEEVAKRSLRDWTLLLKTERVERMREGRGAAKGLQRRMCHRGTWRQHLTSTLPGKGSTSGDARGPPVKSHQIWRRTCQLSEPNIIAFSTRLVLFNLDFLLNKKCFDFQVVLRTPERAGAALQDTRPRTVACSGNS